MSTIVPTILTDDEKVYKDLVGKFHKFSLRVQVDVTDGVFAETTTLKEDHVWWPEGWEVDIHMMVEKPSEHMDTLLNLKPSMIILHAEVEEDISSLLNIIKKSGIRAGVALQKQTFPGHVAQALHLADHAMIFSGELGKQGGHASLMQLEKVRLIRQINPEIEIGWDGGVRVDNAFTISQGGVDVLNVGSAITDAPNPEVVYKALMTEINKHGIF
jgi:Pentose-5-phosphate-3-epimerase